MKYIYKNTTTEQLHMAIKYKVKTKKKFVLPMTFGMHVFIAKKSITPSKHTHLMRLTINRLARTGKCRGQFTCPGPISSCPGPAGKR